MQRYGCHGYARNNRRIPCNGESTGNTHPKTRIFQTTEFNPPLPRIQELHLVITNRATRTLKAQARTTANKSHQKFARQQSIQNLIFKITSKLLSIIMRSIKPDTCRNHVTRLKEDRCIHPMQHHCIALDDAIFLLTYPQHTTTSTNVYRPGINDLHLHVEINSFIHLCVIRPSSEILRCDPSRVAQPNCAFPVLDNCTSHSKACP